MTENTALQRIEHESEPEQTALVPYHPMPPPTLFGTSDPAEVIAKATAVASSLKDVLKRQGLISNIQGKEYPKCEAWTLLGTILGVFPVLAWTKELPSGYEARVEARTKDGAVVGAAEAICTRAEKNWSNRDDFALKSMAQTRATAKALRMPLGFVMTLAGYQPTPAEEMDFEQGKQPVKARNVTSTPHGTLPLKEKPTAKPPAPAQATEEQRLRWIAELNKRGEYALGYCYDKGWLLPESGPDDDRVPGEPLECLRPEHVPTTKRQAAELLAELDALLPVDQARELQGDLGPQTEMPNEHPEPERAPDDDVETMVGLLEAFSEKSGTSAKGKWTRFGVKVSGQWFSTFNAVLAKACASDKGHSVRVFYKKTERGCDLVGIERAKA